MTNDAMSKFEGNKNWQATAKHSDGRFVAVMRGQPGGGFQGNFYLYEEDWKGAYDPIGVGMKAYSADQIASLFSSGEISLVRGAIPTHSS